MGVNEFIWKSACYTSPLPNTLPNIILYMNIKSKNTALNIILDKPNIKDGSGVLAFFS